MRNPRVGFMRKAVSALIPAAGVAMDTAGARLPGVARRARLRRLAGALPFGTRFRTGKPPPPGKPVSVPVLRILGR